MATLLLLLATKFGSTIKTRCAIVSCALGANFAIYFCLVLLTLAVKEVRKYVHYLVSLQSRLQWHIFVLVLESK